MQPPSNTGPTTSGKDSLGQRISTVLHVIVGNGWANKHQVDHAIAQALVGSFDHVGVGRFLVEQQVITRDQAQELDEILGHQGHFPGYKLIKKIGSGGMGTVFLADHLASGRQVALKTMNARLEDDKDFVGRFHREAEALLVVKHPNIAEIIESGETGGHCWLAMEFIDGPSLMHLLKEYRVLPEAYALRICRQVAAGLGHVWNTAHLVHRDIKPENILVIRNRNGNSGDIFPADDAAKLIDFGLVKSDEKDDRLTQTGMTIGTPLYMSPEQVRGEKLDCRSDIYGLGATLYHLLTGYTPFTGTSPGSIMSAHLTEPVPDPGDRVPSLAKSTRQLVTMAMAKDTGRRFLTFDAFVQAIDEVLKEVGAKTGTLRLLRKPLVKPPPPKKPPPTEDPPPIASPPSASPPSASPQRELSDRFPRGSSRVESKVKDTSNARSGLHANPGSDRVAAQRSGAHNVATASAISNAVSSMPDPTKGGSSGQRSKVFDEDPDSALHMGLLPWLVLGVAIVGLVVWLLFFN